MLEHSQNKPLRTWEEAVQDAQQEQLIFKEGDLVRVANVEGVPQGTVEQKARYLFSGPDESGAMSAWVAPVETTPGDIREFKEAYKKGARDQERFLGFYPIERSRLTKLSDA